MLLRVIQKGGEAATLEALHRASDWDLNARAEGAGLLHFAAAAGFAEVCLELLEAPTFLAVNDQDSQGCTALHYAACKGRLASCRVLLDHWRFAAHNVQDWNGWTALHAAAAHGQSEVCLTILNSARFQVATARDKDGMTALLASRSLFPVPRASMLFVTRNPRLHLATSRGFGQICAGLLQHKAFSGTSSVDNFGRTVHAMRGDALLKDKGMQTVQLPEKKKVAAAKLHPADPLKWQSLARWTSQLEKMQEASVRSPGILCDLLFCFPYVLCLESAFCLNTFSWARMAIRPKM